MPPTRPAPPPREVKRTRYVGIDVGKKRCAACITDENGVILRELTYRNTRSGIEAFARTLAGYGECCAVLESTGNLWLKTFEILEAHGVSVKLANTSKTRAIAEARIKTDRLWPRILAHLLRADLVAECYVAPGEVRRVRALLRQRAALVRMRTKVKNRVHSLLDRYGYRSRWSDTFGVQGLRWLRGLEMDPVDRCILDTHLRHLECLNGEIRVLDSWIASGVMESEDARLLMTLTGVDFYGAMLIACEIGDIARFPSPKNFVSWIGLCPSLHQSGSSTRMGRLKKNSNGRVR